MKAIRITPRASLDTLRVVEVPDPGHPEAGELRVRICASSLNYHDLALATGGLPLAGSRLTLGEAAGVVDAIGEGVEGFAVGDAVISRYLPTWQGGRPPVADFSTSPGDGVDGFAAEFVVQPAGWFTRAPSHMSLVEAATVPVAAVTAWRALVSDGGLKAGDTVLVLGTGGVSIYALQIAKAMGARVAVTSSSDDKLERARGLGADWTVNYRQSPDWGAEVRALTGDGVDHVVEVGGPGTIKQSIAAARIGGRIAMVGILTGLSGELPLAALTLKQLTIGGLVVGSLPQQLDAVRGLEAIGLRPVIDRTFPLEQLAEAFRHQSSGGHFGKIAITL